MSRILHVPDPLPFTTPSGVVLPGVHHAFRRGASGDEFSLEFDVTVC